MTIDQMRILLGLGPEVPDEDVVDLYAASFGTQAAISAVEPISIEEARKHLRVDSETDDDLINDKIGAAREWVEDYTGLFLVRREVTERVSGFGSAARLRAWPVAADQPVSIAYRDRFGDTQTISGAAIRATTRPAILYPAVMLTAYYDDREGGDLFCKAEASAKRLCRSARGRML
jgi:hypothetical protein